MNPKQIIVVSHSYVYKNKILVQVVEYSNSLEQESSPVPCIGILHFEPETYCAPCSSRVEYIEILLVATCNQSPETGSDHQNYKNEGDAVLQV